jgi:hypothetical protein
MRSVGSVGRRGEEEGRGGERSLLFLERLTTGDGREGYDGPVDK